MTNWFGYRIINIMKNLKNERQDIILYLFLISRAIRYQTRHGNKDKMHRAILLLLIRQRKKTNLQELSKLFFINLPALSEIIQKLEEENLIKRYIGQDKREKIIKLTDKGKLYLNNLNEHIESKTSSIFKNFNELEIKQLSKMLFKILSNNNNGKSKKETKIF